MNNWVYNEEKYAGVDYSQNKLAGNYDNQHLKFRNYEQEYNEILEFISLENIQDSTLIDMGCGTGAIAIHAAKSFQKIYAVDISKAMIDQARKKAENANVRNVEFVNAGFLTYEHKERPADVIMTKAAFHHLPDFWKQIALLRMNEMVKTGGLLYIFDVVFNFDPSEFEVKINEWISLFGKKTGAEFKAEIETHIRDEFSTFTWILDEMLKKAGFTIEKFRAVDGFTAEYLCRKESSILN
jgi:putative AdoMet-dependent methyltransferase